MCVLRPEDLLRLVVTDDKMIDTSGIKLTLFKVYRFASSGELAMSRRLLPEMVEIDPIDGVYYLDPGAYLIRYGEYVEIPPNCIALVFPRSSLLRMGATIFTAVWDPGYEGQGVGLLQVFNPYGIRIERGAQVAQMVFIKMTGETKFLYRGTFQGEKDIS